MSLAASVMNKGPFPSGVAGNSAAGKQGGASEELSEREAIRRAQQGDATAFERLYQLHSQRVYALCLRMVRNTAEAEELTQEAFLQVFRKIATFRGESAFSTWLHRLAVNVVLMRLRRKRLVSTSLENATGPNEEGAATHREIGGPDPLVAGMLDRVDLERAIERLPEGYKAVFILHDIQGYEHNEIARIMDRSVGNSKSQLHKARMRLRDCSEHSRRESPAGRGRQPELKFLLAGE
jgi:RNA polymerase sigma-70 factor (ECF subfamily)